MNRILKHKAIKDGLSLFLGVFVAIAILLSQSIVVSSSQEEETKPVTEQQSDQGDEAEQVLTISQDAVSSVAQITISHSLRFISDIYQKAEDKVEVNLDQKVDFNPYFRALFRLIISPNAP